MAIPDDVLMALEDMIAEARLLNLRMNTKLKCAKCGNPLQAASPSQDAGKRESGRPNTHNPRDRPQRSTDWRIWYDDLDDIP